jgi:hypothetical protein
MGERDTGPVNDPNLTSVYEGSKMYTDDRVGTMSWLFTILQLLMLLLWNLAIADEVQQVTTRFIIILGLPRGKLAAEIAAASEQEAGDAATDNATETTEDQEAESPILFLTAGQKWRGILLSLIPRTLLTLGIFYAGVD